MRYIQVLGTYQGEIVSRRITSQLLILYHLKLMTCKKVVYIALPQ